MFMLYAYACVHVAYTRACVHIAYVCLCSYCMRVLVFMLHTCVCVHIAIRVKDSSALAIKTVPFSFKSKLRMTALRYAIYIEGKFLSIT